MKRISAKMKLLSLAILGLGGMAMAGSAAAACPTSPSPPWTSSTATLGTVAIASPGYDSTACKLSVALNQNALLFAKALVTDASPTDEQRYRAQFLIDTSELAVMNSVLKQVQIFTAASTSSPTGVASDEVNMALVGGASGPALRIVVADGDQSSHFKSIDVPLPNQLGVNRVEFDLTQGASGTFRYWVTSDATVTSDSSPTGSITVNNSGWSGVTQASLGLFAASNNYRSSIGNTTHLYLDQFDSRRSMFIGKP
jgi:hypothetical protein